jgi:hypothetical protein
MKNDYITPEQRLIFTNKKLNFLIQASLFSAGMLLALLISYWIVRGCQ